MAKNTAKLKGKKKRNSNILVRNAQTHNHITPKGKRLRKEAWLTKQQQQLKTENIQNKYEKLVTVSEETINIRTKEIEKTIKENKIEIAMENIAVDLGEMINLFDNELIELSKVYCAKTGQLLFEYSNQMIQESIKLLGIKKTKEFLKLKRKTEKHYHPITVYNNPENLRELNKQNPILYWIVAANKFFNNNTETLIKVHEQLANIGDPSFSIKLPAIIYCNELLRRYLGLSNANNSTISLLHRKALIIDNLGKAINKTVFLDLYEVIRNQESLTEFTNQLKAEIYNLIKKHCKVKKNEILQEQQIYLIDLAMIKNTLCGDTGYFRQKKIKNATQEESIKYDMLEIFDDDMLSSMRKMDNRRDHLDADPPVPLHVRKEREQQEKTQEYSDNFNIEDFETICNAAEIPTTEIETTDKNETSTVKPSNPFAGIF